MGFAQTFNQTQKTRTLGSGCAEVYQGRNSRSVESMRRKCKHDSTLLFQMLNPSRTRSHKILGLPSWQSLEAGVVRPVRQDGFNWPLTRQMVLSFIWRLPLQSAKNTENWRDQAKNTGNWRGKAEDYGNWPTELYRWSEGARVENWGSKQWADYWGDIMKKKLWVSRRRSIQAR